MDDAKIIINDSNELEVFAPSKTWTSSSIIGGYNVFSGEYPIKLEFGFTLKEGCQYPFGDTLEVAKAEVMIDGRTEACRNIKLTLEEGMYKFRGTLVAD